VGIKKRKEKEERGETRRRDARETLRGDSDGDGDGSALPEASGECALVTENRSSQSLATLLVYTRRDFWRARSALAARCRRPIDADRSRPPRTTLTLAPITRNYVLLLTTRICTYARTRVSDCGFLPTAAVSARSVLNDRPFRENLQESVPRSVIVLRDVSDILRILHSFAPRLVRLLPPPRILTIYEKKNPALRQCHLAWLFKPPNERRDTAWNAPLPIISALSICTSLEIERKREMEGGREKQEKRSVVLHRVVAFNGTVTGERSFHDPGSNIARRIARCIYP